MSQPLLTTAMLRPIAYDMICTVTIIDSRPPINIFSKPNLFKFPISQSTTHVYFLLLQSIYLQLEKYLLILLFNDFSITSLSPF